jgi:hypothetical protein
MEQQQNRNTLKKKERALTFCNTPNVKQNEILYPCSELQKHADVS